MSRIKPEVAQRRIEYFTKRFGKGHLYLAYHGAFPLALTPDLLYSLWVNFRKDIHGKVLSIPWIAVADLLLSALCDEVGHELYEMDLAVRNQLLKQLHSDERFGKQRINQLSNFLLEYVQNQLQSQDPDIQDFAKTQQWIALAYTQPTQAARELALAFSNLDEQDKAEMMRMASLTETFTEPLSEFQPLLIYARGMGKFALGNLSAAKNEFEKVLKGSNNLQVADINLPVPEEIKVDNSFLPHFLREVGGISRRQLLKWTGFGGVGLVSAVITRELSWTLQLKTFSFKTVTVNAQGVEINPRNGKAKYFEEDLGSYGNNQNNVILEMVQIPGGTFIMGSPADEAQRQDNEGPQHEVTVPEFFMGRYPVTQAQYQAIMGQNPSSFKGQNRPVESVTWNDAMKFCKKLSQNTGRTYRLPSEAEWEYACRAGTTTPFHFGETITTDLVNYNGNYTYDLAPKGKFRQETVDVDIESFFPNSFGLSQMHGNIWEWCLDTWHDSYEGAPQDGSSWVGNKTLKLTHSLKFEHIEQAYLSLGDNDKSRMLRGGSWTTTPEGCLSLVGIWHGPDHTQVQQHRVSVFGFGCEGSFLYTLALLRFTLFLLYPYPAEGGFFLDIYFF